MRLAKVDSCCSSMKRFIKLLDSGFIKDGNEFSTASKGGKKITYQAEYSLGSKDYCFSKTVENGDKRVSGLYYYYPESKQCVCVRTAIQTPRGTVTYSERTPRVTVFDGKPCFGKTSGSVPELNIFGTEFRLPENTESVVNYIKNGAAIDGYSKAAQ